MKNDSDDPRAMSLCMYRRELTRTKKEILVAVHKPEHALQPKTAREFIDEDGTTQYVGWVYVTALPNSVVIQASINVAAKCIVDGTNRLSTDEEIAAQLMLDWITTLTQEDIRARD